MCTLWGDPSCFICQYTNFLYIIAAKITLSYVMSLLCKMGKKLDLHFMSLS